MRVAADFKELDLSEKQQGFLRIFLKNISTAENIERIILFGSCASGKSHENSDIDLFVVTKQNPTLDEEVHIMAECPPDYEDEYYVQSDIIIKSAEMYDKYKNESGMLQKYVELEGVDLSGLLQERRR